MSSGSQTSTGSLERRAKLPEEIIATQQSRSDLLKWKLLLVAGLGAAGVGLMEKRSAIPLVLGLIPFACLYVDLLCTHLRLRQVVIGTYFATSHQDAYESFVGRVRRVLALEDWALYWSSAVVSFLVAMIGAAFCWQTGPVAATAAPVTVPALAVAGPAGSATNGGPALRTGQTVAAPERRGWLDFGSRTFQGWVITLAGSIGVLGSFWARNRCREQDRILASQVSRGQRGAHQDEIQSLLRPRYALEELEAIRELLINRGTFRFPTCSTGLFPAADLAGRHDRSGYQFCWVRDNVHVAHAHYATGDLTTAVRAVEALLRFFRTQRSRFQAITAGKADPSNPMNRPHIRFDGERLAEVNQRWSHAQNDALGYFLWLYCRLARGEPSLRHREAWECLLWFPAYLDAIRFWEDPDSGHWEEPPKVSASSIGTVVAGLRQMKLLVQEHGTAEEDSVRLDRLIEHGVAALQRILPCEAREPQSLYRRYDAALLFLLYPLEVEEVLDQHADTILADVTTRLQGEHGIRRYLGDSYWFADYKAKLPAQLRTADLSASTALRDAHLRPGEEAQWCLFDPLLSVIHGRRAARQLKHQEVTHAEESRRLQVHHLNRALGQLTGGGEHGIELRCPEAYYLCEGRYVPNDHTPLLWTQANLWLALHELRSALQTGVPARGEGR